MAAKLDAEIRDAEDLLASQPGRKVDIEVDDALERRAGSSPADGASGARRTCRNGSASCNCCFRAVFRTAEIEVSTPRIISVFSHFRPNHKILVVEELELVNSNQIRTDLRLTRQFAEAS
ncbi:MAG: hypothetical protein MPN21_19905 [Thermoanaerobaculia bacterium]|nr:hypothetical protein [Thermoanaerobaculia bacterium]